MSVHENNVPSISHFHLVFCQNVEFTYLSYDVEVIRPYYKSYANLQNFFLRDLFKMEYENVKTKHKAQEKLEIDLEDLEDDL